MESTPVAITAQQFFSNTMNKEKFIRMLATYLREKAVSVETAEEDADALIIQTAVDIYRQKGCNVTVVGNDTDLLVLLVARCDENSTSLYFNKIASTKTQKDIWYCAKDQQRLKSYILFAHAVTACDTTSAKFNVGKKKLINILQKNVDL